jgi:hypothetical protein
MTENTYGTTAFTNAQKEMRSAFLGGFAGQLVSGLIWIASAAISMFSSSLHGVVMIAFAFVCRHVTLREEKTMWGLENVS